MDAKALQYSGKWIASAVVVPIIGIALYLMSVFGLYVLAWILGLIGTIFR